MGHEHDHQSRGTLQEIQRQVLEKGVRTVYEDLLNPLVESAIRAIGW